jgi:hypothetical protein
MWSLVLRMAPAPRERLALIAWMWPQTAAARGDFRPAFRARLRC